MWMDLVKGCYRAWDQEPGPTVFSERWVVSRVLGATWWYQQGEVQDGISRWHTLKFFVYLWDNTCLEASSVLSSFYSKLKGGEEVALAVSFLFFPEKQKPSQKYQQTISLVRTILHGYFLAIRELGEQVQVFFTIQTLILATQTTHFPKYKIWFGQWGVTYV